MHMTSFIDHTQYNYTANPKTIRIAPLQRQPNVFDVGLALYKCYTNVGPTSSYSRKYYEI